MEIEREDIVRCYCAETEEGLAAAEEALVRLETAPGDAELLRTVFRVVHTVKGNSLSLGYSGVADMAHAVEDRLARLREGSLSATTDEITVLLRGADALRQMAAAAVAGAPEWLDEHKALLEQLRGAGPTAPAHGEGRAVAATGERRRGPGRRREEIQAFLDSGRTLRVESARLDRLLDLTGETAIARSRVRRIVEEGGSDALRQAFAELEGLSVDLQDFVMRVRMVPVGPTFRQFLRAVRDLAVGQGKVARLATEGDAVEIDITVVEHLKDALTHLVRNAIDHGIETPDGRRAAGKDPCGTIALRARHEAGSIVIEVEDDGAGLDLERIAARARAAGRIGRRDTLSVAEAQALICEPGFSTVETATNLSGRGVGLDVVRQRVEHLGGAFDIRSTQGKGTTFTIRFPLTLAVLDAFTVSVGGEEYLIPTDVVVECLAFSASAAESDGRGVVPQRGGALSYARLRTLLGLAATPGDREQLVVVRHGNERFGLVVDAILGQHPAVIKPLGRYLDGLDCVAGCAVMDSGRVGLILDLAGVRRRLRPPAADLQGAAREASESLAQSGVHESKEQSDASLP